MGDDNNIFGPGEYSLLDRFIGILDRQTDAKLSPNQLMGFLSLFNLLGTLDMVRGAGKAGIKDISNLANLTSLVSQNAKPPGEPALKDMLMGLLGTQNQSGPDLGGLLNMVGGNKKINPQLLLTLMNLLSSQAGSGKSDKHTAKSDAAQEEGPSDQAGGEHQEKERNVELKYDKKKTS